MFLTAPQSSHFSPDRFRGRSPGENHFDWELYYRFKDLRERFWRERLATDDAFQRLAADHFAAFQRSVDTTLRLLGDIDGPHVLDVGLSSEQLDRAILKKTRGQVTVLDIEEEAGRSHQSAFAGRGAFVLGDVITYAGADAHINRFDLVYSVGLIEHFPDKTGIVGAHVRLAKPGGLVLLYVPIDTAANRALTAMAYEWENFGHRELMTPSELRRVCERPDLELVASEAVGFYAAVWARKTAATASQR